MSNFTPWSALAGGILIGLAATLLLAANGRIAGVSGVLNGAMRAVHGDTAWRVLFLLGLIAGAGLWLWFAPPDYSFAPRQGYPLWLLASAGALVGFGTRLGGGCTSGHGVCGIARLSVRSIAATLVFMAAGMAAVYVLRHVAGIT
jgi:uncharacterized membrane protein YedE/YeeE